MSQQDFDDSYRNYERYMNSIRDINEDEINEKESVAEKAHQIAIRDFEERMKKGLLHGQPNNTNNT
jgi:hypothetical protein